MALIDAVMEQTGPDGDAPTTLSVRELGRRVLDLYWDQARPFSGEGALRQSGTHDLVAKIAELRQRCGVSDRTSLDRARVSHPQAIADLEDEVVDTMVRYPIPLLQRFGTGKGAVEDRFIYEYGAKGEASRSEAQGTPPDEAIRLVDGAGAHLSALAGLIRPIIKREWLNHIANRNQDQIDELRLESFLFGAARTDLSRVREPLLEHQHGDCFYCRGQRTKSAWEVDHFLPWSRWPDDGLDNLVVAHRTCNNDKRSALPALTHLDRWWNRLLRGTPEHRELHEIATDIAWPRRPESTAGATRALYLHQPEGVLLWEGPGTVEPLDRAKALAILRRGAQ